MLHSWAGSDQMTRRLAHMHGVYFSLSGHTLGLSDKKLASMLREVRPCSHNAQSLTVTLPHDGRPQQSEHCPAGSH